MLSDKITVIIKELHFTHVGHTCKMYAVTDNWNALFLPLAPKWQKIVYVYEDVLTFTQVFNELIDLCYSLFS